MSFLCSLYKFWKYQRDLASPESVYQNLCWILHLGVRTRNKITWVSLRKQRRKHLKAGYSNSTNVRVIEVCISRRVFIASYIRAHWLYTFRNWRNSHNECYNYVLILKFEWELLYKITNFIVDEWHGM